MAKKDERTTHKTQSQIAIYICSGHKRSVLYLKRTKKNGKIASCILRQAKEKGENPDCISNSRLSRMAETKRKTVSHENWFIGVPPKKVSSEFVVSEAEMHQASILRFALSTFFSERVFGHASSKEENQPAALFTLEKKKTKKLPPPPTVASFVPAISTTMTKTTRANK